MDDIQLWGMKHLPPPNVNCWWWFGELCMNEMTRDQLHVGLKRPCDYPHDIRKDKSANDEEGTYEVVMRVQHNWWLWVGQRWRWFFFFRWTVGIAQAGFIFGVELWYRDPVCMLCAPLRLAYRLLGLSVPNGPCGRGPASSDAPHPGEKCAPQRMSIPGSARGENASTVPNRAIRPPARAPRGCRQRSFHAVLPWAALGRVGR